VPCRVPPAQGYLSWGEHKTANIRENFRIYVELDGGGGSAGVWVGIGIGIGIEDSHQRSLDIKRGCHFSIPIPIAMGPKDYFRRRRSR
jgi:hypothetical protein